MEDNEAELQAQYAECGSIFFSPFFSVFGFILSFILKHFFFTIKSGPEVTKSRDPWCCMFCTVYCGMSEGSEPSCLSLLGGGHQQAQSGLCAVYPRCL